MRKWVLILLVLLLAACSGEPTQEPTTVAELSSTTEIAVTATSEPTSLPTNTVAPTEIAVPTDPPMPTDTPAPTATNTRVPTATPIPVASFSSAVDLASAFTLFTELPVLERETGNKYLNGGAVIYLDGAFHLFSNFFNSWPGETVTYYYTSENGQEWTRSQEEPLFAAADVPLEARGIQVLDGLIMPDGTWALYYHTFTSSSVPGVIGRATAPGPLGPWSFDEAPVLIPGSAGEWDDTHVMRANVLPLEEGYVMYYAGITNRTDSRIGLAFSDDGINWQKYDDPTTTEAPYAESDPIMEAAVAWEGSSIGRPEVVRSPDGWVMLYSGGRGSQMGLAVSEDGIHFRRYDANPFQTEENMVEGYSFFQGAFYHEDETYYWLIEAGVGRIGTDVYLYTLEGSIFGE